MIRTAVVRPLPRKEHAVSRPPTAAQRRVIDAADPVTGRLRGTEAQLDALVKRGLAFRHPRPPHDHFLTPAGHRVRETVEEAPEQAADPPTGVFSAHVGGTEEPADTGPARTRARAGPSRGAGQKRGTAPGDPSEGRGTPAGPGDRLGTRS